MNRVIEELKKFDGEVTSQIITDLIREHKPRATKMKAMYDRYKAEELPIQHREFKDPTKINNKINNDYRGEIINTESGYVHGVPIVYQVEGRHYTEEELLEKNLFLDYFEQINYFPDIDYEVGKMASICGYGARLIYIDKEGLERVINIDPWEVIFIENPSTKETEYAMRYYPFEIVKDEKTRTTTTKVEWYDDEKVTFYIKGEDGTYILDNTEPINPLYHTFDYVPMVKFKNNDEELGSFEKVEELIDGYDRLISDAQNEMEEFRQAYMKFIGASVDKETILEARASGAFNMPDGGDIGFITKDINDQFLENHKKTLNDNIYKFSQTVDMGDEKFSGGVESGESRKWKLLSLENKAITKERKFIRALQEQFKIISSSWKKKNIDIPYTDITFTFTRNIPIDMLYYADITQKLKGLISDETLFANIPFINDPQLEIEKMKPDLDYIPIPDEVVEDDTEEVEAEDRSPI